MSYSLLVETINVIESSSQTKDDSGRPTMKIGGNMLVGGVINKNGRVYEEKVLDDAINKIMPSVKSRACLGELNHPADYTIDLKNASHIITSLEKNKKPGGCINWYGEAELIVNNPSGKIVKNLIEAKANIGFSSRGLGKFEERLYNGKNVNVVKDYHIVTPSDIVANPSAPNTEIMTEMVLEHDAVLWNLYEETSKFNNSYDSNGIYKGGQFELYKENGKVSWRELLDNVSKSVRNATRSTIDEAKKNAFLEVLKQYNREI